VALGLIFVFSSSYPLAGRPTMTGTNNPYYYFWLQVRYASVGLIMMLLVSLLPVKRIAWLAWPGFIAGALGMIAAVIIGKKVGGAYCWLPLGSFRFQPSEFAKVAYLVLMAITFARGPMPRASIGRIWVPALALTGVMALILAAQRDVGMAMLVCSLALGMALLGGMRLRYWVPLATGSALLGLLVARATPHAWVRFEDWLHPEDHLQGGGAHVYSMLVALARGGPLGLGLGMSPDKWTTLPVPHTDSIFCVVGGELGLWGGIGVILLMTLLAVWAFRVARACPHRLGFFIAAGAGLSLALQAFINIAVATALLPVTGLTLPFMSAGGSSLMASLLCAGLVLAVAAESRPREEA
jgi:cell division protein FtsW